MIEIHLWKNREGRMFVKLVASDRQSMEPYRLPRQAVVQFEFSWEALQRKAHEFAQSVGVSL